MQEDGAKRFKLEDDEVITFNVRGRYFSSLKQTLLQRACPRSPYFETMLSGKFAMVVSPKDGAMFLDRNPDAFKVVWNYLLDEPFSFERCSHGELQAIRVEADYFQVNGLVLPPMFSPQTKGSVTFSEGGTVASRVHASYKTCYIRSIDPFVLPSVGQFSEQRARILTQGKKWCLELGLAPDVLITDPSRVNANCGWFLTSRGTLIAQNGEAKKPYCSGFKQGSVVAIRFHHDRSVSFLVDGVDQGVAYANVDVSQPLFLVVKLMNWGDMVQLL